MGGGSEPEDRRGRFLADAGSEKGRKWPRQLLNIWNPRELPRALQGGGVGGEQCTPTPSPSCLRAGPVSRALLPLYPTIRVKSGLGSGAQQAGLMRPSSLELSPPGAAQSVPFLQTPVCGQCLLAPCRPWPCTWGDPRGRIHELERVVVHCGPSVTPESPSEQGCMLSTTAPNPGTGVDVR